MTRDVAAIGRAMDQDGVAFVPALLSPEQLGDVEAAFDWTRDHRGPGFTTLSGDPNSWQDLSNPAAYQAYAAMLRRSPIPPLLKRLWGGGPVWFMYEQIFSKTGTTNLTPWHQDSSYQPVAGSHLAVVWISLDPVSRDQTLEFVRASHRGPLYNGSRFTPGDPTDPLYATGGLPRLPDIEADRVAWDIVGWATNPGDILIFNPATLHGGGSPGPLGRRRTLTLRFFGEDTVYDRRPGPTAAPRVPGIHELRQGAPFRHADFPLVA